jgi:biotin operon repressor
MTWIDTAAELKFDKKTPWTKMVQAMQEQGYNLTYDAIRNALRRHPRYKENEQFIDITESVLKLIERPIKIDELSQKLNISKRITIATIEDLKEAGFTIEIIGDLVALYKAVIPQENVYKVDWNGDQIIKFGVVSDPHM